MGKNAQKVDLSLCVPSTTHLQHFRKKILYKTYLLRKKLAEQKPCGDTLQAVSSPLHCSHVRNFISKKINKQTHK